MIRILVNVPPHVAGAVVSAAVLGDDFAAQLVAAGQAEEVEDESPADPVEALLHDVFELEDQIDGAINRRTRIVLGLDGLAGEDLADARDRVVSALDTASRVRPELFGLTSWPMDPEAFARWAGFDDREQLLDRARIGAALLQALPEGFVYSDSPVEIITLQADRIGQLEGDLQAAKDAFRSADGRALEFEKQVLDLQDRLAAFTDTPPPPAEPSGDAAGASAPAAEPEASPPAQPAGKPAGAAKAKRAEG